MTRNAGCGEETNRDALLPRAQSGSRRLGKPEDASLEAILAAFVSGDHRSVVALSGEVIRQSPTCAFAWKALGSAQLKLGQHEEAVRALGTATELDPLDAEAHNNLGNAEMGLGKLESALARYDRALQLRPDHPEALNNRGVAGHRSGRAAEALADFDRALELDPGYVEAWHNRGSTLRGLGRLEEALASHDRGLTLRSDSHEAHAYRGRVLQDLSRFDEALASYAEALRIRPDFAAAQHDRANVLVRLGRLIEAVAGFDQVLASDAKAAGAWNDRGTALLGLRRFDEALDSFGKALDLRPGFATACFNRGVALRLLGRLDEALASMREARRLDDSGEFFAGEVLGTAMRLCAWEGVEEEAEQLRSDILAGKRASTPFPTLALLDDPLTHLKAAQTWASARHPIQQPRPPLPAPHPQAKIRIGYYSADFHNHATAYLIAGLLEAHDTSQFEIHAFSFGPHSNDPMRSRITNSVSQFLDVSLMSDTQVAQLSRQTGIDIAIDLKGFTMDSRPGIFAAGCAPIQVSYLGYPGSMGCNFIDYIIADHTTIPTSLQHLYSEKIIRLPHTYQANDNKRSIANSSPSRQDANLPDNAFVFCCFNNNYKILPSTFKLWMLILKAVPNSVLWLLEDNPWAKDNLRKQATLHNINPNRLVFAKRLKLDQHLARHQLANLFLDTFPYNAHTTASDALWAGLPLLTLQGQSFASRVAASLLNSLNLPQLITHSPSQYLQTAIQLANNPNTLSSLRKQLLQNQLTTPLFNTTLFTKNLELAYQQIQQHSRSTPTTKHINIVATNPPQNPEHSLNQQSVENQEAGQTDQPSAAETQRITAAWSAGRFAEVATLADELTRRLPRAWLGWRLLGAANLLLGRADDAVEPLQRAVAIEPADAKSHNDLGIALGNLGRSADAMASFDAALRVNPDLAEAHNNRGVALQEAGRLGEALAEYEAALRTRPQYADAHLNQGIVLLALRRPEAGLAAIQKALEVDPHRADAHSNHGAILEALGRAEEALESYEKARSIKPEHADANWNRSALLLKLRRFSAGFGSYHWRWRKSGKEDQPLTTSIPPWDGAPLAGRLLLWGEQGLGDEIFFASMLSCLPRGPTVTLTADRRLLSIYARSFPGLTLLDRLSVAANPVTDGYEAQAPIGDLGHLLGIDEETIGRRTMPFLTVDAARRAEMQAAVARFGERPVCGIAWRSANRKHGEDKSIRLNELAQPLLRNRDLSFVNLQYGDVSDEIREMRDELGAEVQQVPGLDVFNDLEGLLALIDVCDVVLTTSNVTAHLAGALGKPAAVLVPCGLARLWYWHEGQDHSPWYPSLRLFFQQKTGGWTDAIGAASAWARERATQATAMTVGKLGGGSGPQRVVAGTADGQPQAEEVRRIAEAYAARRLTELAELAAALTHRLPACGFAWRALGAALMGLDQPADAAEALAKAVDLDPSDAESWNNLGLAQQKLGHDVEALASIDRALAASPGFAEAHYNRGNVLLALQRPKLAVASYEEALRLRPEHASAHNNLGNALGKLGRPRDALASYEQALRHAPELVEGHLNRGIVLQELERQQEALQSFDTALQLQPGMAAAWKGRGDVLAALERREQALASYERATSIDPDLADAHVMRSRMLRALGRPEEALASCDRVLELRPGSASAFNSRGVLLHELGRLDQALDAYASALSRRPDYPEALNNRANVLKDLRRLDEARADYERALEINPALAEGHNNLANLLRDLDRLDEALSQYDQAIQLRPEFVEAHRNRGATLHKLKRFDEAADCYAQAWRLAPDSEFLAGQHLYERLRLCAWEGVEEEAEQLRSDILAGKRASTPFPTLALLDDPLTHLKAAQTWASARHPIQQPRPPLPAPHPQAKIRIGYYSADFHNHATAYLIAGLLEAHDTSQFEIHAFSFGPHSNDPMRSRITNSVSQFLDVSLMSDTQVAQLSRQTGIDIAIDLKGFTMDSRPGIFAAGCAPIQVSYLGYPGSMGCNFIDYIIADHTTIPTSLQHLYSEKIIRLPHTYQANDNKRSIANSSPSRQDANLPDNAFVFCCFNNNYKILPSTFKLWMLILKAVPNSVLWLLEDNPWAKDNLRKQATLHNINPNRLVFAKRLKLDQHLARHQLANLFLDTFPCNAHTTASDALWAGLPLLTLQGQSFASRVAASLLNSLNLPQLITHSPSQYLQTAIQLANNPNTLSSLRKQLLQNQLTTPLFNTTLFTKNLELAYQQIQQHSRSTPTTKHINIVPTNPPQNPEHDGAERNW